MKQFFISILDLIYKKKCYFCGKSKSSLKMCPACYEELCFSETHPNRIIDGVNIYSCGIYEKHLQKLIRGLKYHKQKELGFYLAKFMFEYFSELGFNKNFQVIPTPLHKNRIKKRKYNHMEIVAEEFCKFSDNRLVYNPNLIKRIKDTKPQYKLKRSERLKNLSNAFEVDTSADMSLPVLILDDICTTGATFEEMIKTLKASGITDIVCLAASNP